jgi:hypothetical protein
LETRRCEVIRRVLFQFLIVAVVCCALVRPAHAQNAAKEAVPAFGDPSMATDKRVDDLVSRRCRNMLRSSAKGGKMLHRRSLDIPFVVDRVE